MQLQIQLARMLNLLGASRYALRIVERIPAASRSQFLSQIGGIFLSNFTSLFNGHTVEFMTLLFFATGGLMALFKVNKIAEINFYLTLPIFGFIIYLLFFSFPYIKAENFFSTDNLFLNKNWFLPYGVWLFSLTGFSAIPPTRDLFIDSGIKKFKRVISISLFLAIFAYILFVF